MQRVEIAVEQCGDEPQMWKGIIQIFDCFGSLRGQIKTGKLRSPDAARKYCIQMLQDSIKATRKRLAK